MNSCPLCSRHQDENAEARFDVEVFSSRFRHSYRSPFMYCEPHQVFYNLQPPKSELLGESYEKAPFVSALESRFAAEDYFEALRPYLKKFLPSRALDVGAGDGAFLKLLGQNGVAKVEGLELNRQARDLAYRKNGIELIDSSFESFAETRSYDLLTCFQVLSHLPDPKKALSKVSRLLRRAGLFVVVDHDPRSGLQRFFGKRSPIFDPSHYCLWTRESLIQQVEKLGFRVLETKSFSNRYPLEYWLRMSTGLRFVSKIFLESYWWRKVLSVPLRLHAGNRIWICQKL